jgi:hypothetical protein
VTNHVTNHPGNLNHVTVNPRNPKEIEFSNERIEIQISIIIDSDSSIHNFLLFYKVDFDFNTKTSIHPCDLL